MLETDEKSTAVSFYQLQKLVKEKFKICETIFVERKTILWPKSNYLINISLIQFYFLFSIEITYI